MKPAPLQLSQKPTDADGTATRAAGSLFKKSAKQVCVNCGRPTVKVDRKTCKSWFVGVAVVFSAEGCGGGRGVLLPLRRAASVLRWRCVGVIGVFEQPPIEWSFAGPSECPSSAVSHERTSLGLAL
jgi:hypothetical protein